MIEEKSDQDLVRETKEGNLSSFEMIVRRYQRKIYFHNLHFLKDPDEAEDATQETFVRAFENLDKFEMQKPLEPWIFQISSNYCISFLRKNSRLLPLKDNLPDEEKPPLEKMIEKEEKRNLRTAIEGLPKIYQMKLPLNTVRTRLRRRGWLIAKRPD